MLWLVLVLGLGLGLVLGLGSVILIVLVLVLVFLVNIMFEIVGREVTLSLSLHTSDGYTRLALCIALFFMEI